MTSAQTRYHGLDLLRAVAMLLGLVLHAELVLIDPVTLSEVLQDLRPEAVPPAVEAQGWVWATQLWIHLWRMPVFFLLSGFFAAMMIERKGRRGFFADRFVRIFLALLVFMAIFTALGWMQPGELHHLWFLWFLAIYCALAALLWPVVQARAPNLTIYGLGWVLPIAVVLTALRQDQHWHHIPTHIWSLEFAGLFNYLAWFVMGLILWRNRMLLLFLPWPQVWGGGLVLGTFGYGVALLSLVIPLHWSLTALASGAATAGYVVGFTGLALKLLPGPSPLVAWLVRGAYPIYLFHLYPILGITALMVLAGWAQVWVVLVGSVGGFLASVALWYLLVRFTPLDWLLSGPDKSWLRWPFGKPRAE